jgi:dipeptidyl-peptidase-4
MSANTFPRQYARTQRLTLGEPRTITASNDRVIFLRSSHGSDPVQALWVFENNAEHLVVDPRTLLTTASPNESPEERARRERAREGAQGITSYACNPTLTVATFVLGGRLFVTDLNTRTTQPVTTPTPVFDPRPNPDGSRIAFTHAGALHVVDRNDNVTTVAHEPETNSNTVTWGQAEFIAAEEMGRSRGHWWSPDGTTLAATRVDVALVTETWIANPAQPQSLPQHHRYPFAGTNNAEVQLHLIGLDGSRTQVMWDHDAMPYLARVSWTRDALLIATQSRDQRTLDLLEVNPATGTTTLIHRETDEHWVELVPGSPARAGLTTIWCGERNGARALITKSPHQNETTLTPPTLQVRAILDTSEESIHFLANNLDDPTSQHVWRYDFAAQQLTPLTTEPGVHSASTGGNTVVIRRAALDQQRSTTKVGTHELANHAETPLVTPNVTLHRVGDRNITTAILLPHHHDGSPLPVLFDPYGGPHAQRVVSSSTAYVASQWFADQGFVVVVADGRGTPARGSDWERAVAGDLAAPVLEDQLLVLDALPTLCPFADLSRVAIRGWSFGGYLAALAVLRTPKKFHAGIAGAPVTDWRLYDTHYTERYLGHPTTQPTNYERTSLITNARTQNPIGHLLLIHGLADDNVLAAHTLQLSSALLEHGKPHRVLPLSGVTHMTPQEVVAENLLLHQLAFLRESLG